MRKTVLNVIILCLNKSKYYSIFLDSTSDESRVDQLTLIFCFVEDTTLVERFVTFMAQPRSRGTRNVQPVEEVSHNS